MVPGQPHPFGTPLAPLVPCVFGAPRKLWPQQPRLLLGGAGRGGPPRQPRRNAGFPPVCLFYSKKKVPTLLVLPSPHPNLLRVQGLKRTGSFPMLPIRRSPFYTAVPLAPRPRAPRPHLSPLTPRGNGPPTQRVRGPPATLKMAPRALRGATTRCYRPLGAAPLLTTAPGVRQSRA